MLESFCHVAEAAALSSSSSSEPQGALEFLPPSELEDPEPVAPKISTTTVIHARKAERPGRKRRRVGSDNSVGSSAPDDAPSSKKRTPPSPAVSRCGSTTESDSRLAELLPTHDDAAFAARAASAASFAARLAAAGELRGVAKPLEPRPVDQVCMLRVCTVLW